MKYCKPLLFLIWLCLSVNSYAQLSTNELPFSYGIKANSTKTIQTVTMPNLNMEKIEAEDKEDEEYDMPPRFGYSHKVNLDLNNSGTWTELPNGDKLWQLNVICPNALSINFCYDKFWLPIGGKFFVYSKDKKHSIGAFTSRNNKGNRDNLRGFATGLVYGNDVILEYYQPKEVSEKAIISIEYVVHGYRLINIDKAGFGTSGSCQINVNCDVGQSWQNEKKAVALIIVEGERWCTGSLINTTDLSQKPYFLTANHCLTSKYGNVYDADSHPNADSFTFYWNYEAPGCANVNIEPPYNPTSGAIVLANNHISDFALLRLSEDPIELPNYIPFYLGWDWSGQCGNAGVCIHHPSGDVKKISKVATQPVSTDCYSNTISSSANYWRVTWANTLNGHGTTEGGSSGSPLFTANHKVIGQLRGGRSDCYRLNEPDWYGKFSVSWTGDNNSYTYRRLNCWLDSINAGVQTMEGLLIIPSTITMSTNEELYSNIRITNTGQLTIQSNIELKGNSSVIVEAGGQLIIDGGTLSNVELVLKTGAFLQIKNGGILDTRNGFEAPLGAVVDVEYGQIM